MKNRTDLDLKVEILQKASQNGGTKKTHLMRDVGFSHNQLKGYLNELVRGGYVREEGGFYRPTNKGSAFLEGYRGLVDKGFGDILGRNNHNNGKERLPEQSKRLPPNILVYARA